MLDGVGMVPFIGEPADLLNCGFYAVEGEGLDAAISCASAVPGAGQAVKLAKLGDEAVATFKFGCSFSGDTVVSTPDGEVKIEDLAVGDTVFAWDEETGETGSYEVTAAFSHEDRVIEYLVIDGERLVTTPEHPFYTKERGWVPAGDLEQDEQVRQADGTYGVVESLRLVEREQRMYNLTVDEAHTYFVGDGQWLVHNMCGEVLRYLNKMDVRAGLDGMNLSEAQLQGARRAIRRAG